MDLHVLVANLDGVVIATFDLVVDVEFYNRDALVNVLHSQSTP